MKKVFLVDDEPIIVKGLRKLISWESVDCEIVGEAYEGMDAFEFIKKNNIDIVITDLLMPEMSGIDLIKKLKEEEIKTEVIILSGYDEFDYAHEALKLGVFEYLLKPVSKEQLHDTIQKVVNKINTNLKYIDNINKIKEQLAESLPILRDSFILDVIRGEIRSNERIKEKAEILDIDINGLEYEVLAIEIDNIHDNQIINNGNDEFFVTFEVENIVNEIIKKRSAGYVITSGDKIYALIISKNKDIYNKEIFEIVDEIKECLLKCINISVNIGIGRKYSDILSINKSYKEAKNVLKSKFLMENGSVLHINNILFNDEQHYSYPENSEKKVLDTILYSQDKTSEEIAEYLIESFTKATDGKTEVIYDFCLEFLVQLIRNIRTLGGNSNKFLDFKIAEEKIKQCKTILQFKEWLSNTIENSITNIACMRKESKYDSIQEAKNYINSNYSVDISLNRVASLVYMSPTYFSALFKSKTGENFSDYLSKVRMENAARMLVENKYKTYEISENVGYSNPRYFSDAFKRYFGLTPSEYRAKNIK